MADDITGRDGYIMAQALILAINAIDDTNVERRQFSNRDDMMKLLLAICPNSADWSLFANSVGVDPPPGDTPVYEEWLNAGRPKLRLVVDNSDDNSDDTPDETG